MSIERNTIELQSILDVVNALPEAGSGGSDPVLQEKTVSPSTSSQSVTADSGYDGLSKVTVNAIPTATQATPSISVSSNGLITASATQDAGYVTSGTKSATKQLTTKGATTITPSENSQTAVASGVYTTGAITVDAIPDGYMVGNEISAQNNLISEQNAKIAELAGADSAMSGKISALEAKFGDGEGSVSELITDAMDAEVARVDTELAKKVDKVDGMGLSHNDLTGELKGQYDAAYAHSQVAHAPSNAQENILESVKVNGTALTITGKAVDIAVPTDNAELANGAGYLVAADVADKADKATTLEGYGIADAYTSAQVDTAIANAMANLVECEQSDIEDLFA